MARTEEPVDVFGVGFVLKVYNLEIGKGYGSSLPYQLIKNSRRAITQ